ncbi:MAG: hypothetical protein AVO38_06680 [delta proteobacterium ML8_D]|jgi:hypothetical protein|nr:MAG: hypothetical protein AVO38_06680 [delta proteobacterium ML8_D]
MKHKIKFKWIFMAILVVTAILVMHHKYNKDNESLPDDLIGRWITSSPRYNGRFLELSQIAVIFGVGEDNIDVNFISSVEKRIEADVILYTIKYRNQNETEGSIVFYWYPSDNVIRLKNQRQMIWKKSRDKC